MPDNVIFFIMVFLTAVSLSGCAQTAEQTYYGAGSKTICSGNVYLGHIAVLPETDWREDQKEPEERQSMALREIMGAFSEIPCGNLSPPGGIKEFSDWSAKPESELLKQFFDDGVDTVIMLRLEELTPRIYFTFSLPILWGGSNEADFRIRMLSVQSGKVLSDMRLKRSTGGPFNIRPAGWSGKELREGLRSVIGE